MSQEQRQERKTWIEEKLRELCQEYGVPLQQLIWGPCTGKDFDTGTHTLKIITTGKPHIEKFSDQSLEDWDKNLEAQMHDRLVKIIKALV